VTGSPLLIDRLLAEGGIQPALQPVYEIAGAVRTPVAVECLSRGPKGSNAEQAPVLFDYVRRKRREAEIDRACLATALSACESLKPTVRVGVNVHASTLARDADFPRWFLSRLQAKKIDAARVVMEIVEHGPAQDLDSLARALTELRVAGVRLALDDMGIGTSGLRLVVEWAPEYIKIDRFFVEGARECPRKLAVLRSIVAMADGVGASTIVEGVETEEQLQMVIESGVKLVQGYVFCRPLAPPELARRVPELFQA
jgi:EAL domain-containing protein (putative c-di-GMP-specific phosphodiesterase class I)